MSIKVGMVSLGCPKNQVDAETMLYRLSEDGCVITSDAGEADAVIINTCGFIEAAKQEAIDTILEFCQLKQQGVIKAVVVTGCLAQRYAKEIKEEIPEVDAIVGLAADGDIVEMVQKALSGKGEIRAPEFDKLSIQGERLLTTPRHYAYLKIAEGCDNRCSFCAIPLIRGRYVSRPMEEVVAEAKSLAKKGVRELILVAQDTTKYGEDLFGKPILSHLLRKLCEIEGFKWIRLLYCYPDRITDELIDTISGEEKIVKYLDIPIQHVSKGLLRRMNRHMSGEQIEKLVDRLRQKIPGIELRTTLIAGFPGETEEDFVKLVEFVKKLRFEKLGCFAYSPEEGTPAADMPDQISEEIRQRRAEIIMQEQQLIAEEINRSRIGQTCEAVVEGCDECGYFGRALWDAPEIDYVARLQSDRPLTTGDFVTIRITGANDMDLAAEVLTRKR